MQEKTSRNKEIFKEWRIGLVKYAKTANIRDKIPYSKLALKHGLSKTTIITICQRELHRLNQKP